MSDGGGGSVRHTRGTFVSPRGPALQTHAWHPSDSNANAAQQGASCELFILHGYAAHGAFPTVRLLAEHLAARGFVARSLDFEGCGGSEGLPGLINDYTHLVTDALAFVEAQRVQTEKPAFILGTSMGGALALMCSLVAPKGTFAGVVVLSPMVVIPEAARPSALAQRALRVLGLAAPWAALIGGSSSDPEQQYRDATLRAACTTDRLSYHGRMRIATAASLLQLSQDLEDALPDITVPFLALHGTADTVVDISSSRLLVERASSEDKRLREVPNALHSLLCEPPGTRADVLHYITEWLEPRAAKAAARTRATADRLAASPRMSE